MDYSARLRKFPLGGAACSPLFCVPYFNKLSLNLVSIGKDRDSGKDWGQEEKGTTEDEMAGWHHRLDAHESE